MKATTVPTNVVKSAVKSTEVNVPETDEVNVPATTDISEEVASMLTPEEIETARRLRESQVDNERKDAESIVASQVLAKEQDALKHAEETDEATKQRLLALQVENELKNKAIDAIRAERLALMQKNPPKTTSQEVVEQLSSQKQEIKSKKQLLLEQLAAIDAEEKSTQEALDNVASAPEYELYLQQCAPFESTRDKNQVKIDSETKVAEDKIDAIRVALSKKIAPYVDLRDAAVRQLDLLALTNPRRKSTPAVATPRKRKLNGTTAASATSSDKSTTNLTTTYHIVLTRENVMTITTNPASKVKVEKIDGVDTGVISTSLSTQTHRDYEALRALKLALGASLVPDEKGFKRVVGGSFDESINIITPVETK